MPKLMVQTWWLPNLRGPVHKSWGIVLGTLLCVALYTNPAGILVALLSHAKVDGSKMVASYSAWPCTQILGDCARNPTPAWPCTQILREFWWPF